MRAEVLQIEAVASASRAVDRAAALLCEGELVAFPTETVYGLGANALDEAAVRRIFAAKGRPAANPIIVHIADSAALSRVALEPPAVALKLAERFWPGPLTMVFRKRPEVPDAVTAGGATVAVRVPAHPVAQALLRAAKIPVAAPSANASNHISATQAEHVLKDLGDKIRMILDAGPAPGGLESTVLDVTSTPPRLLRPGLVSRREIEAVIGEIAIGASPSAGERAEKSDERRSSTTGPLRSPGMLKRHYAPRVPLECVNPADTARIEGLCERHRRIGWLALSPEPIETCGVFVIEMPNDAKAYAAELYAALHAMEAAGVERIVVTLPPERDEWAAIRDRLQRASAS